jgi:hypothetical protein
VEGGYNQGNGIPGYSLKEGTVKNGIMTNLPSSAFEDPKKKKETPPPTSRMNEEMKKIMSKLEGVAPRKSDVISKKEFVETPNQKKSPPKSKEKVIEIEERDYYEDVDDEEEEENDSEDVDDEEEEEEEMYFPKSPSDPLGDRFEKESIQYQKQLPLKRDQSLVVEKENKKQKSVKKEQKPFYTNILFNEIHQDFVFEHCNKYVFAFWGDQDNR